ncbi:Diguanylate cyclase, predicted domain protein, partial [Candidatus Magnetoovum chiemensis]
MGKIKNTIREEDVAGRYGGEEYTVLLPNTELNPAVSIAQKIRKSVEKLSLLKKDTLEKLPPVTISLGVSEYDMEETRQSLLDRADKALYQS